MGSYNQKTKMWSFKLLALLLLAANDVYGSECNGFCRQGEGDCDSNSECIDGLVCEFDGWWGTDYCRAGPDTVDYSWSAWGDWSDCSVQCGADGTQERFRYCNPPKKGGYDCPSQLQSDAQTCNNGPCPVDGGWGEWSSWPDCPVSCGGGTQGRSRVCDSPAPEFGGDDCTVDGSSDLDTQTCNENPCPIHGGWGDWTEWEECPVSCGGADQGRTRACDSPSPEFGGDDCTVDGSSASETQRCNENPCPIDGGFSDWDEWSPCTVECGGGDQTRNRRCDNPVPEFGGLECVGDFSECQRCNMDPCPSQCPA